MPKRQREAPIEIEDGLADILVNFLMENPAYSLSRGDIMGGSLRIRDLERYKDKGGIIICDIIPNTRNFFFYEDKLPECFKPITDFLIEHYYLVAL